jgi:hypothetical protein
MKRILLPILVIGVLLLGACAIPSTQPSAPAQPTITENPRYIYENGAVLVGGDDNPIELINNPSATNPTYAELLAFIKEDTTDKHHYADSVDVYIGAAEVPYVCSDFAEDVHNNAEAAGIRTAWVSIDFEGNDEGHALNAFETTDRGLVYIDCTGQRFSSELQNLRVVETEEGFSITYDSPGCWDSIAYIEVGKEYGLIPVAKAELLSYSFYEEYKQKLQEYEKLVGDYNDEVMQFNQEVSEYGNLINDYNNEVAEYNSEYSEYERLMAFPPDSPWRELAEVIEFQFLVEYGRGFEAEGKYLEEQGSVLKKWREELEDWEVRLEEKAEVINDLGEELGDYWVEPLGIAKNIYIHW